MTARAPSADAPSELLVLVDHLLGPVPDRSIVVLAFAGLQSRGALRHEACSADPAEGSASLLRAGAAFLTGLPGVDSVAVVAFSTDATDSGHVGELVDAFLGEVRVAGLRVLGGFRSTSVAPHRPPGRSLSDDADRTVDGPVSSAAPPPPTESLGRNAHPVAHARLPVDEARFLADVARRVDELLDRNPDARLPAKESARVRAVLDAAAQADPEARPRADAPSIAAVIAHAASTEGRDELIALSGWHGDAASLATGGPPDPIELPRCIDFWTGVVAAAPSTDLVQPLAILAWLSWNAGNSVTASVVVQRGLALEPGHVLLRLLHRSIEAGASPAWWAEREVDGGVTDGSDSRSVGAAGPDRAESERVGAGTRR